MLGSVLLQWFFKNISGLDLLVVVVFKKKVQVILSSLQVVIIARINCHVEHTLKLFTEGVLLGNINVLSSNGLISWK